MACQNRDLRDDIRMSRSKTMIVAGPSKNFPDKNGHDDAHTDANASFAMLRHQFLTDSEVLACRALV